MRKLYRVRCGGFDYYVIATDETTATKMVQEKLTEWDWGFYDARKPTSIDVLASEKQYDKPYANLFVEEES